MNAKQQLKAVSDGIEDAMAKLDAMRVPAARAILGRALVLTHQMLGVMADTKAAPLVQQEFTKMIHVKGSLKAK